MKLIIFNKETSAAHRDPGKPSINFNIAGAISLSPGTVELLKLKVGDKVSISQDEESPDDWFLYLDKLTGFPLRAYKGSKSLAFNCSSITKGFIKFMEVEANGISCPVSDEVVKHEKVSLYPILTKLAKYNLQKEEEGK